MKNKIGFYSALTVTVATILFAIGLISGNSAFSFVVCMFLAWGYVMLACSFAAEASPKRRPLASGGIAFACIYTVFVCLVYFTQLTAVANGSLSDDLLKVLSYQSPGSLMFSLDLFGYAMMAISTFLIGLTIKPETQPDKWMKYLLMAHGAFAPVCIIIPMANVFNASAQGGAQAGTIVLLVWCCYFAVTGVLVCLHYKKAVESLPFKIVKNDIA